MITKAIYLVYETHYLLRNGCSKFPNLVPLSAAVLRGEHIIEPSVPLYRICKKSSVSMFSVVKPCAFSFSVHFLISSSKRFSISWKLSVNKKIKKHSSLNLRKKKIEL